MNFGFGELGWVVIVAIILFGPSQLPKLARGLGEAMREFKKAQREIKDEVMRDEPTKTPDQKTT